MRVLSHAAVGGQSRLTAELVLTDRIEQLPLGLDATSIVCLPLNV
jgi:hypothetical protein